MRELAYGSRTDLTIFNDVWSAPSMASMLRISTPKGVMEMMLLAKGGVGRLLRIDAKGRLLAAESLDTAN